MYERRRLVATIADGVEKSEKVVRPFGDAVIVPGKAFEVFDLDRRLIYVADVDRVALIDGMRLVRGVKADLDIGISLVW